MRIDYPTVNRNDFMSNNPIAAHVEYVNNAIGPHANTERWSFVVPANQLGVIQGGVLMMTRITVAAPAGMFTSYIDIIQGGTSCYLAYFNEINNGVGASYYVLIPSQIYLLAGDSVSMHTADLSTGGTISYVGSLNVLLYNQ